MRDEDPGGRPEDVSAGSTGGRSDDDVGSRSSRRSARDEPRAYGSTTPGAGTPVSGDEANADADATGPSEGTPEDLKPGGERPGIEAEDGPLGGDGTT